MEEQPRSGLEFLICSLSGVGLGGLSLWLVRGAVQNPTSYQGHEMIGAVCLLALAAYFGYLSWCLHTCRYSLAGSKLTLRQGLTTREVDLTHSPNMHRWKPQWMWSRSLQGDLGLTEVDLFPPISFFREHSTWVLVYTDEDGEARGVAFRPSPRLIHQIRDMYLVRLSAIGEE